MGMIRYPLPISAAMVTPANENTAKPRYDSMTDWVGGVKGDDVDQQTATVAVARSGSANVEPNYAPRNQQQKATALGTTIAPDLSRARGPYAPSTPYLTNFGTLNAPVVSSLSPSTGAQASLPMRVTITGTGFSVWSKVFTGGSITPETQAVFVNATTMYVPIWAAVPGTVSVAVEDHDMMSNTDKIFTVT